MDWCSPSALRHNVLLIPGVFLVDLPRFIKLGNGNRNTVDWQTLLVPLQQLLCHLHLQSKRM